MKCQSCQELVSPKFAHALAKNECPFCGNEIISPKLQEIFAKLQVIMKEAEEFPDLIADWLFSNYQLKKAGYKSPNIEDDEENDDITPFARRAGIKVKPAVSSKGVSSKFAQVLEQIQKGDEDVEIEPKQQMEEQEENDIVLIDGGSKSPLGTREQQQLVDLFDNGGVNNTLEAEKLRRMQKQFAGDSKIKRAE